MGNIKNYNINKSSLKISNSDFWDFFLAADDGGDGGNCEPLIDGECGVVWYDFNNSDIFASSGNTSGTIFSLKTWDDAINSGLTINTIGLTGIDNGLITFEVDTLDYNPNLLTALTGSTLIIPSGDTRLTLNPVTGTTGIVEYPMDYISDTYGKYMNLCGGFYQGYYKLDGYDYEVLPNRVHQAWSAEFWLKPQNVCSGYTGTTLNDLFPENNGIFFYLGTRAENKFWNTFNGVDSGCTSGCTIDSGCSDTLSPWCTIPKETDIVLIDENGIGIPLNPPLITVSIIDNPFLIYGRANKNGNCGGCGEPSGFGNETACSYTGGGITVVTTSQVVTNTINPFLIYGRASKDRKCGCGCGESSGFGNETACSFSGFTSDQTELDYNLDIIDNALGFRIKDDGSIGYRLLSITGNCSGDTFSSGTTIQEEYSISGLIKPDEWSYIVIRFVTEYYDDCDLKQGKQRLGKLMFYVNGKLKFIVHEFPEFIAKRLNENKMKQVGVPFNISLGGGTQGLFESQTFDGLDMDDRDLPIEKNFSGTFIGGISQFKFNICDLNYCQIQENYNKWLSNLMLLEDGSYLLLENGLKIKL